MQLLLQLLVITTAIARFTEHLKLTQYPDGKVLASFKFTRSGIKLDNQPQLPYDLLPKSIKEIILRSKVVDFKLTFTKGRWYDTRYGYQNTSPSGANLVSWFQNSTVDANFQLLVNGLAGLTCSSLNFMTSTISWSPTLAYQQPIIKNLVPRVATLPREVVCTENLTPWAKLLPCETRSGLARLLNGYKLFDADYQALGIEFVPSCKSDGCNDLEYKLIQTVTVLVDPIRTLGTRGI